MSRQTLPPAPEQTLPRRDFLRVSAAIGGGLLIAFRFSGSSLAAQGDSSETLAPGQAWDTAPAKTEFVPNAFVRIAPDGRVTVMINKAEMGQGPTTSLCMLLCEELDADWTKVGFEFAPADMVYAHPGYGIQFTGGSTSTAGMSMPMRKAGATARAMLVEAAAKQWNVEASACRTQAGFVSHDPSSRKLAYGALVADAAKLEAPKKVALKDPSQFVLIGQPTKRLDTPDKVFGRAAFSIDVTRPGMLTALVAHPPTFGGKAKSVDSQAALAIPGVKKVVEVSSGVAVIADGFWAAKRGRDALKIEWDLGPNAALSTSKLHEDYKKLAASPGKVARKEGDPDASAASAKQTLTAEYELPYLAHAPMEPLNCVVDLKPDSCEVWAGSQFQTFDHAAIAKTAGLDPKQCKLHTTYLGGGFGRRACPKSDYIVEAVEIAKQAGAPLKLVWTRTDDLRGGFYRPMWTSRLTAGIDAQKQISTWTHTIVGESIMAGTPMAAFTIKDGIDSTSVEGAKELPYAIPNLRVDLHTTQNGVPVLWWRSVGHTHTAFVTECFLDECAHAMGADPFELRHKLLAKNSRWLGVLERAGMESHWGKPLPAGRARGIAIHESFESVVCDVMEVSMKNGWPRVHKVTRVIDCGTVVNPDTVHAQLEGAVGFALTAALYSAITLQDGRVEQSNFHDYKMVRMDEMPAVEVHIVPSNADSTGVGEPGVPTIAPALCNAIFALTGKRVRRLPLRREDLT
jgi:isoquinoline 1-oxidoreductase beta subunit